MSFGRSIFSLAITSYQEQKIIIFVWAFHVHISILIQVLMTSLAKDKYRVPMTSNPGRVTEKQLLSLLDIFKRAGLPALEKVLCVNDHLSSDVLHMSFLFDYINDSIQGWFNLL